MKRLVLLTLPVTILVAERLGVTGRNWRMVAHLFTDVAKAFILSHAL